MSHPTLYKRTSTGAIQFWDISVYEDHNHSRAYIIETQYGQLDTPSPQLSFDTIYEGKNIGRSNETSVREQSEMEAKARWEKQVKKGYVEDIEKARAGKDDVAGGILPMLAHKFTDHGHKIKYPCAYQKKLDGIRCIAVVEDGKCTLWSRTRKPIISVPHIQRQIESLGFNDLIFDGELYHHDMKAEFEKIVSLVRQEIPAEGHEVVQYHVYDAPNLKEGFLSRQSFVATILLGIPQPNLVFVSTGMVHREYEIPEFLEEALEEGYEGIMLRNLTSPYVNKRSYDLQKVKVFDDSEFDIIGVKEGRGKMQGLAIFECVTPEGNPFEAKLEGELSGLKKYFDDHSLWTGKKLTVRYQGFTGKNKVPRFPIGVAVRDYE